MFSRGIFSALPRWWLAAAAYCSRSCPASAAQADASRSESVDAPLPTILRSEADMPEPVRATRQKLIEAAKSGDMEKLRALMQAQPEPPVGLASAIRATRSNI